MEKGTVIIGDKISLEYQSRPSVQNLCRRIGGLQTQGGFIIHIVFSREHDALGLIFDLQGEITT